MKDLSEIKGGAKGIFFALAAAQKVSGDTSLALFGGNSGAMIAGHVGTITEIDYKEVQGRVPMLEADQVITIGKEEVRLGKKGERPWALTIVFDTGRTMTVGLLLQGQDKTTITFKGQNVATPVTKLTLSDLEDKLLGKTLRCDKYFRDKGNEIIRNDADGNQISAKAANCYVFTEE